MISNIPSLDTLSRALIIASSSIILLLGTVHLIYTFFSKKFYPRDIALQATLQSTSPIISPQTTLWKAMIGFNASHSIGFMMFGLVYGYFAIRHLALLLDSPFLSVTGLLVLLGYLALAKMYWFSIPLIGIALALICYVAGFAISYA